MPKDNNISPIPATITNVKGILNVHFTTPRPLIKSAVSGFIIRQQTISPTTVDIIIDGINESAVCTINCLVVKPIDFKIP